ncbi:hypothetical protein [Vibrio phage vB_VmeM-Yong XC32]|nr:hypothetical protein [Vibrio phage vB_VmeM-Yong XC31]QAX96602.1 hypothetical protein [Vibrio phage vB_VmeM-Yong XC32]QAX96920.1 hypothetical protein [Vibrio phage vB_VmeM-Yong MS31]QAX97225.1 hypothetical protein [Vibrio phage vB_VmeM-Yong MS32]
MEIDDILEYLLTKGLVSCPNGEGVEYDGTVYGWPVLDAKVDEVLRQKGNQYILTVYIDDENDNVLVVPGHYFVNRQAYLITEQPHGLEEGQEYVL